MGFLDSVKNILEGKANKIIDENTDPNEQLDLAYMKMQGVVEKAEKNLVGVTASIARLRGIKKGLEVKIERADAEARAMVERGKDDLAKKFIEDKLRLQGELNSVAAQTEGIKTDEDKLKFAISKLKSDMTALNTKKETLKAQHSAADAQVKITESLTGLSDDTIDIGKAIQKAEEKIDAKTARADAIEELTNFGILDDHLGNNNPVVSSFDIEAELEKLKKK